jgi:hypothetical protein
LDNDIVIACHCEKHRKLYLYFQNGSSRELEGEQYVDPYACPGRTWERIKTNSIQYIWGQFCPIYLVFFNGFDNVFFRMLINILNEASRILKVGGSIIFPIPKKNQEPVKYFPKVTGFTLEIKKNDGLPINIYYENHNVQDTISYLIIFTKLNSISNTY